VLATNCAFICHQTPPLETHVPVEQEKEENIIQSPLSNHIKRIFLLTHHKEIGMAVDTAKLLLSSFPVTCKLVVGGIDGEYQSSMNELKDAIKQKDRKCMVLFPSDDALTYYDLKSKLNDSNDKNIVDQVCDNEKQQKQKKQSQHDNHEAWDVIIMDGTWAQARKLCSKYVPSEEEGGPYRLCLSQEAVNVLNQNSYDDNDFDAGCSQKQNTSSRSGRQLRRHPIKWKEISTLEATRLMIGDILIEEGYSETVIREHYGMLAEYQFISDTAVTRQLGAPRLKKAHL